MSFWVFCTPLSRASTPPQYSQGILEYENLTFGFVPASHGPLLASRHMHSHQGAADYLSDILPVFDPLQGEVKPMINAVYENGANSFQGYSVRFKSGKKIFIPTQEYGLRFLEHAGAVFLEKVFKKEQLLATPGALEKKIELLNLALRLGQAKITIEYSSDQDEGVLLGKIIEAEDELSKFVLTSEPYSDRLAIAGADPKSQVLLRTPQLHSPKSKNISTNLLEDTYNLTAHFVYRYAPESRRKAKQNIKRLLAEIATLQKELEPIAQNANDPYRNGAQDLLSNKTVRLIREKLTELSLQLRKLSNYSTSSARHKQHFKYYGYAIETSIMLLLVAANERLGLGLNKNMLLVTTPVWLLIRNRLYNILANAWNPQQPYFSEKIADTIAHRETVALNAISNTLIQLGYSIPKDPAARLSFIEELMSYALPQKWEKAGAAANFCEHLLQNPHVRIEALKPENERLRIDVGNESPIDAAIEEEEIKHRKGRR